MTPEEVLKATLLHAKREKMAGLHEGDAREMARRAIDAASLEKKPRAFGVLAVAAVALLCVVGGFGVATLSQSEPPAFVQKLEVPLAPVLGDEVLQREAAEALAAGDLPAIPEAAEAADVRLPTGDRMLAASGTHYDVVSTDPDRVVALREGDVLFDIESIAGGSFVVDAGDTQVRVLGTVFSVRRSQEGVAVLVYEGRVAVTDSSGERVLGAGEFWASNRSLVDAEWREASEARWNALVRESGTGLSTPQPPRPVEEAAPRAEEEPVRALLLRREYRDVLEMAQAEMNENGRTVEWAIVVADAYRGLQDWQSAAPAYRSAAALARGSRRAQLGYAAAQIYADRLHRPRIALEALEEGRSANTESIVEERARSLQIRLFQATHQSAALEEAVDTYLERFPDTYTARRLRAEH
ncbi:MAG: hypothetical protein ACI9KE_000029 [Polyangiales bacterium]|jgi:hypothetical protein